MDREPSTAFPASLQSFEPFDRLAAAGKSLLARGLVIKTPRHADVIVHKGQPVSGAYVVLEGRLRVYTIAPNGTEATLYLIEPGETCVLALNCLFNDLLYPAWVQADAGTRVAILPGEVYRQLFETEPAVRAFTVRTLSTLVYRLMTELEQVHGSHHRQRLAQLILHRADSAGILHMTQQQMAGHLGTTREVVARLMQDFVGRAWVRTRRGQVVVTDVDGLRQVLLQR